LAVAFGVLIFLGFEQSFVLGEEVRDVHGDVPKAIYVSLAAIGLLLLISTYAMVLGFGSAHMDQLNDAFAKDGTPFWRLTQIHLSTPWRDALQLVAITSILGNLIASHNCVVRIEYGMGRAGAFPRVLGWTSKKFRTPYIAISMQTGLSILAVAAIGVFWNAVAAFGFIGFAVGLAASVSFIAIMAAAIRYFRRTRPQDSVWFNYVIPAIGIVILLPAVYTSFYPNPGLPLSVAPWALVAWLIVGAIFLFWRERRREPIDIDYAFKDLGEPVPEEPVSRV
jgi:amino acid transporter